MQCQNCGRVLDSKNIFFRAGKNGTPFCSKSCIYEAFEGYYSKQEVDRTIERSKLVEYI